MAIQPDLRLYGRDGHLVLIADIRARHGTSPEWAAMLRRNLMEHDELPNVEFFLIATPDQMYLWKGCGKNPSLSPPTYVFDARSALKSYSESAGLDLDSVDKEVFELLVLVWLSGLARWRELNAEGEQSWIRIQISWRLSKMEGLSFRTRREHLRRVELHPRARAGPGTVLLLWPDPALLRGG